mgnify:CR=1 FL=1
MSECGYQNGRKVTRFVNRCQASRFQQFFKEIKPKLKGFTDPNSCESWFKAKKYIGQNPLKPEI